MLMKSLYLVVFAVVLLPGCSSTPPVRDASHDDPRKVAEIARLTRAGGQRVHKTEPKFTPKESTGWAVYKLVDETKMISALEVQTFPARGGRVWIETRNTTPTGTIVTRMVTAPISKPTAKTKDGKYVDRKVEQVLTWKEGDKQAEAFPADMLGAANSLTARLAPHLESVVNGVTPTKQITVPAGTFKTCFVHEVGSIPLLREAEQTCYSSLIPSPFIVQRKSDSSSQELVRYGFEARTSFIPPRIKVVEMTFGSSADQKRN